MPLLERDEHIARLRAAIDEAQSGAGRLVLVTGEAGVGKTALVDRIVYCGGAIRVWTGSCERLFTARPLGPLADIASKTGGRLGEVVGGGAPVHEVFAVLLDELRSNATLVVIEDVHWADEATLDVIALLARRLVTTHSVAIVTSRDELSLDHPTRLVLGDLASAGVERLRLSPLSLRAVRQLATPHDVDADELFHRTGGNPFYVTEVLATGDRELPPSVRDAVLARAAGLDPDSRSFWKLSRSSPGPFRWGSSPPWAASTQDDSRNACRRACSSSRATGSRFDMTWHARRSPTASSHCAEPRFMPLRCGRYS